MPEKVDMETLLQQKMEQFALEPDPADWTAIRKRLEKKKRRRFLWWIFPFAGAFIGAGILYASQEVHEKNSPAVVVAKASAGNNPTSGNKTTDPNTTEQKVTEPAVAPTQDNIGLTPSAIAVPQQQKFSRTNHETPSVPVFPVEPAATSLEVQDELGAASETNHTLAFITAERWRPRLLTEKTNIAVPASTPAQTAQQRQEHKKLPNTTTHRNKGWYLGVYAGLGSNQPVTAPSVGKAMDLNAGAGNSARVVYAQGANNWQPGSQIQLGLALEKKNAKTSFSTGLGIQKNSWQQSFQIYKDSLQPGGTLFSSTLVANSTLKYQQWAIEIPVWAGFRLAGKKSSSIWFHAGINNAFTLKLNQNLVGSGFANSPSQGIPAARVDSLFQPATRTYLPQLQLGLSYEHAGKKQHWQLSPYLRYGINSVVKQGQPDVHQLQWGLLGRYYFKKIK